MRPVINFCTPKYNRLQTSIENNNNFPKKSLYEIILMEFYIIITYNSIPKMLQRIIIS